MNHLRSLNRLLAYRDILTDPLLKELLELPQNNVYDVAWHLLRKAEDTGLAGDLVKEYILFLLNSGETLFSHTAEHARGAVGEGLAAAARHDVALLREFFRQDVAVFAQPLLKNYQPTYPGQNKALQNIRNLFPPDNPLSDEETVRELCRHYTRYGYGALADHMAFRWNEETHELSGINNCDYITFDDLIGYERQKDELISNTLAFLQDLPANNVLLYGQRGTGKSSSIKALINKFFPDGLRLVEIPRTQFGLLSIIMGKLKNCGKKFILYLDDLSFEEFEVEYKQLKSIIDGGLESKPDNVLIYATSNRRNIVKEVWADNEGGELHRTDTINEKISLADRFGVKIFFGSPNQEEYFKIIAGLAAKADLPLNEQELRSEALKWEMSHTGRSGRTAEQLITYLRGRQTS